MAYTIGDIISRARHVAQDRNTPYRYTDQDYLMFINDALSDIKRMRPDIFVGVTPPPTYTQADLYTQFPISPQYFTAIYMYVASQIGLDDDKYEPDGKVNALMSRFNQIMVGKL